MHRLRICHIAILICFEVTEVLFNESLIKIEMKQILITTVCLLLCFSGMAQNDTQQIVKVLEKYFALADSATRFHGSNVRVDLTGSTAFIINDNPLLVLNENDLKHIDFIIDWVNDYAQSTQCINSRTMAFLIFDSFMSSGRGKKDKIFLDLPQKQKVVNYILSLSHTVHVTGLSGFRYYNNPDYFNEASKERIKLLLSGELPTSEMEIVAKMTMERYEQTPTDTTHFSVIRQYERKKKEIGNDSLTMADWIKLRNEQALERYLSSYHSINHFLINMIGNAYLYEFSDRLEEIYHDDKYSGFTKNIALVLARLQHSNFEERALNDIASRLHDPRQVVLIEREVFYIYTRSAIVLYSEYLMSDMDVNCGHPDYESLRGRLAYSVLWDLRRAIIDFPYTNLIIKAGENIDGYMWSFCDIIDYLPESVLRDAYHWIQSNKDTIKLNPNRARAQ